MIRKIHSILRGESALSDKTSIKVMADYDCFPLWRQTYENIDPACLDIPDELISELHNWRLWYDSTLDRNDPIKSGFLTEEDERGFVVEGRRLAVWLASVLGTKFVVSYKPETSNLVEYLEV